MFSEILVEVEIEEIIFWVKRNPTVEKINEDLYLLKISKLSGVKELSDIFKLTWFKKGEPVLKNLLNVLLKFPINHFIPEDHDISLMK